MSVGAVFVASWPGAHAWKSCQSARERCHAHGSLGSKYRDAAAAGSLRRSYTGWGPCAKGYVRSVYFQGWLRIGIFPNSRPRNSSWRTGRLATSWEVMNRRVGFQNSGMSHARGGAVSHGNVLIQGRHVTFSLVFISVSFTRLSSSSRLSFHLLRLFLYLLFIHFKCLWCDLAC